MAYLDAKIFYNSLDKLCFDNRVAAVNFYLLIKGVRYAYQYLQEDKQNCLKTAIMLTTRIKFYKRGSNPVLILKSTEEYLEEFESVEELLGYQYTEEKLKEYLPEDIWLVGYTLSEKNNLDYNKDVIYSYGIPKKLYSTESRNIICAEMHRINNVLEEISLEVYPFYLSLSEKDKNIEVTQGVPKI